MMCSEFPPVTSDPCDPGLAAWEQGILYHMTQLYQHHNISGLKSPKYQIMLTDETHEVPSDCGNQADGRDVSSQIISNDNCAVG